MAPPGDFFEARIFSALEKARAESPRGSADFRSGVYLAAVSGGADSTAMLAALAALRREAGFTLYCAHVEHGIRPAHESRGDASAVEALCEKLSVPCRVISIPQGKIASFAHKGGPGIEGAARFFRHKALAAESRRVGARWILTAHTQNDLLETLLMRVLRGSGPAGLAPMPGTRGRMLRPLLELTRADVLEYLERRGLSYRTDSTNADTAFLRNRVRLELVPVLDRFFPSWKRSLLALAETQALTAEFLADEALRRLPWKKSLRAGELRLPEADFARAPLILREEAVYAGAGALASLCGRLSAGRKNREVPAAVPRRAALRRAVRGKIAGDLGPIRLERQNGYVSIKAASPRAGERGFSLLIQKAGVYTLKGRVCGAETDLRILAGIPGKSESGHALEASRSASLAESTGEKLAGEEKPAASFSGASFPEESFPGASFLGASFLARFPLVFRNHTAGDCILKGGRERRFSDILDRVARSGYTGIITVCDVDGPAAFIGIGGDLVVLGRDNPGAVSETGGGEASLVQVLPDRIFIEASL